MSARGLALLALVLGLLATAGPALALPPSQRGEAFNRIEKQTMCIECNVSLNIANAAEADAERAQIRRLLDRGLSERQVLDQLVVDYGPNILATPKAKGFNVLAFAVPVVGFAALLALGLVLLPRWRRARKEDDADDPDLEHEAPTGAENQRLDAELARYGP